jgi:hypothetical protein
MNNVTKFLVLSYECKADWMLAETTQSIGCNRSLGPNTEVFVLIKTHNDLLLGHCGQIGVAQQDNVWACESNKRFAYNCEPPQLLGNLDDVCSKAGVNPSIFRASKIYGYPKHTYIPGFQQILKYIKNLK